MPRGIPRRVGYQASRATTPRGIPCLAGYHAACAPYRERPALVELDEQHRLVVEARHRLDLVAEWCPRVLGSGRRSARPQTSHHGIHRHSVHRSRTAERATERREGASGGGGGVPVESSAGKGLEQIGWTLSLYAQLGRKHVVTHLPPPTGRPRNDSISQPQRNLRARACA